ncbi:MAG: hypothetical protein EHM36_05930 [Deltaproteobacteria bacterium]|nr:MAG: hypothetical protein EHM36_05930 [Deltaproteobacteria bacterium]
MKKTNHSIVLSFFLVLGLLAFGMNIVSSAEHPGAPVEKPKSTIEHPGKAIEQPKQEHPGKAITADFVKKAIEQYVHAKAKLSDGVFLVRDDKLNKDWRLKLVKVHDPVRMFEKDGMTIYFACSDFKSTEGNDVLDLDFWMVPKGNTLEVIDTKVHKVNGEPRYGYEGINIKEIK